MNQQPFEKPQAELDGSHLDVHSIFHTIQGEGPFSGYPAVFIRLAGCNLQCPQCDTEYTVGRFSATVEEILSAVMKFRKEGSLVVITGGEPLRQNITLLCKALIDNSYFVQVETNGTLPPPSMLFLELCSLDLERRDSVFVVCSPKTGRTNPIIRCAIAAYKYVLASDEVNVNDGLPVRVLGHSATPQVARPHLEFEGRVYVQPADEQLEEANRWNRAAVVRSCMEHNYVLQLQTHKILNLE